MRLVDKVKFVEGCSPAALTSTAGDGDYISLKNFDHLTVVIQVNNATTVTGGAVTLKQATAVAGTGEKALAFDKVWTNIDTGASDTLVETAVTSNTFTTNTTDNKDLMYVIEVEASDLDTANGFDCVRVDVASMANAVGSVLYMAHAPAYNPAIAISAIDD